MKKPYVNCLRLLTVGTLLVNRCQVYTMNMNKAPTRWVTVVDADTGATCYAEIQDLSSSC